MRILGWMHNKLRHTSIEPFKDFTIGTYCACLSATTSRDEKISHTRPRFDSRYEKYENTLSEVEAKRVEENYEDETSAVMYEPFHGFLAIGTLGSKQITSEAVTPTLPVSFENIEDEKTEVTENELKLLNDELEKFLEAEAEEEGCNESLARSSYVSTITLSGIQTEEASAEDNGITAFCPLQGYLFGSSIDLPELRVESKKEKASLAEMFHRTKITEEISLEVEEKGEMHAKQAHKPVRHLIKKILQKFYASSKNPILSSSHDADTSVSTKKRLNKVLRMFHRKVHPENPIAEKVFAESNAKIKKNLHHNVDMVYQDQDSIRFLPGSKSMERVRCYKNNLSGSNSSRNREYWIKTDADYLVLEL
ncbi:protein LAZY 1 [Ricinus communis]|uniref:Uncharacterized protein n=1 Tax=Ricinus communis TaxID=3988 RepID=B9RH50_RICCO|nr:protein LAZY 1 [Ricinus communis]EEF49412.1 conserved hypothetical protein [Ricinus communis]|eukprot:XP_002512909.1 protein LAZY 1 isoform X2 [Ricinus communis]